LRAQEVRNRNGQPAADARTLGATSSELSLLAIVEVQKLQSRAEQTRPDHNKW
jgi:hypothetical protein